MYTHQKGFTLIELLVVVLIIGILASMALPQYFKAVERSRMSEAVSWLSHIAQAQQRKFLQVNRYANSFMGLDVGPAGVDSYQFYTKGDVSTGEGGNGFRIYLSNGSTNNSNFGVAERVSNGSTNGLQYSYTLVRYYQETPVTCIGNNEKGQELCADFCGVDEAVGECCSDGTSAACNGHNCIPNVNCFR